jgi:Flp pilus assembly pilin Flp
MSRMNIFTDLQRRVTLPLFNKGDPCMTYKRKNEKGVTVVEYAIMLALIAIAVAVAAPNITSAVLGVFNKASSIMN